MLHPHLHKPYYYYHILYKYIIIIIAVCGLFIISISARAQDKEIRIANEYLINGEKEKAYSLYKTLAEQYYNLPFIHINYFNLLIETNRWKEAESYIQKMNKQWPNNMDYLADYFRLLSLEKKTDKKDKLFQEWIHQKGAQPQYVKVFAQSLAQRNQEKEAIYLYQKSREITNSPNLYVLEMAILYRHQGDYKNMIKEYLHYAQIVNQPVEYAQNLMQTMLSGPDEMEALEDALLDEAQINPESKEIILLLIWTNMQQRDFSEALVHAKAYDRRFKEMDNLQTYKLATVALSNQSLRVAEEAFRFVMQNFPNSRLFPSANLGLLRTHAAQVKKKYPVKKDSINLLVKEYKSFSQTYCQQSAAKEAKIEESLLWAYYLDNPDSAKNILQGVIDDPSSPQAIRSRAKMELSDIYILLQQPWEAVLLLSQVEKQEGDTPLGYEAKFKNAELNYYRGNFSLAIEHLDILKQATSREIANDALQQSLFIKENKKPTDSLGLALKQYAQIVLLEKQQKTDEALKQIQIFEKQATAAEANSPEALLADDAIFLEASLHIKKQEPDKALPLLEEIVKKYPNKMIADDAVFLLGDIYENMLHDPQKAMQQYEFLLEKYPGSLLVNDARKRYRNLRGDFKKI